jgi:hypothetical protein
LSGTGRLPIGLAGRVYRREEADWAVVGGLMLEQVGMAGALVPAGGTRSETVEVGPPVIGNATGPVAAEATARTIDATPESATENGYPYGGDPYAAGQTAWVPPPPSRIDRVAHILWTKPSWLAPLAVLGCIGEASTYVLQNNPTDTQLDPLGPCAFKALTGFDCPGCGGTRMVWYLLHGNVYEAARHHIIALLAVPVLIWTYIVWGVQRVTGYRLPTKRIPLGLILGYLISWFVFAVLRNLPWAPFDWFYVS